jgi:hypothetical protein
MSAQECICIPLFPLTPLHNKNKANSAFIVSASVDFLYSTLHVPHTQTHTHRSPLSCLCLPSLLRAFFLVNQFLYLIPFPAITTNCLWQRRKMTMIGNEEWNSSRTNFVLILHILYKGTVYSWQTRNSRKLMISNWFPEKKLQDQKLECTNWL